MEKKNEQFDQVMREKLGSIQAPFDPDSWQLFEQRLTDDSMGIPEAGASLADKPGLEEALFEKLHRYEAPYQPGHWYQMESLLEEVFAWPRNVLRYKLIELALMFLLFLVLWQSIPTGVPADKMPQAWSPGAETKQPTPRSSAKGEDRHTSVIQSESATAATTEGPASVASGEISTTQPAGLLPIKPTGGTIAGPPSNSLTPSNAPAAVGIAAGQQTILSQLPYRKLYLQPLAYTLPVMPSLPSFKAFNALETTAPALLAYESSFPLEEVLINRRRPLPTLRVGMFGSAEYNHIMVPPSAEKKLSEGFDRYAMGYGGGLSLGLEMGRWELETGAIYAARKYPVGLVYVNGSLAEGLDGNELRTTELNILNVPLNLRYNILNRGSWRVYALTGGSVQVVFQANYFTADAPEYSYRPVAGPIAPAPGDESIIAQIHKDGRGWFEDGTFRENAYITGNLGLGLERYIGARWSLFAQPTYQYSLHYFQDGLGPNNDKINSLSVFFGAKVRLR